MRRRRKKAVNRTIGGISSGGFSSKSNWRIGYLAFTRKRRIEKSKATMTEAVASRQFLSLALLKVTFNNINNLNNQ